MAIAFQLASLLAISPRQFPLFAKYSNRMIFKKQELGHTIPHSNSSGACQLSQNKTQSPCTIWPPATLDTVSSHFPFSHPFKPHGFPYCSSNIPGLVSALVPFLILFFVWLFCFQIPEWFTPLNPSAPSDLYSNITIIEGLLLGFLCSMGTHTSPAFYQYSFYPYSVSFSP